MTVPNTRIKLAKRPFSVAAPTIWNALPTKTWFALSLKSKSVAYPGFHLQYRRDRKAAGQTPDQSIYRASI